MNALAEERRRINKLLVAGRLTELQAQRAAQNLYSRSPVAASTLFDPDSPHPGRFVPFDDSELSDLRHGAQQPQRRIRPW